MGAEKVGDYGSRMWSLKQGSKKMGFWCHLNPHVVFVYEGLHPWCFWRPVCIYGVCFLSLFSYFNLGCWLVGLCWIYNWVFWKILKNCFDDSFLKLSIVFQKQNYVLNTNIGNNFFYFTIKVLCIYLRCLYFQLLLKKYYKK